MTDGGGQSSDEQRQFDALRRLRWLGVGLPIVLLVAIESFRYFVVEDVPMQRAEHVAIAALTGVGIVVFALGMFQLIERSERQVIRQNRELTAVNAVSTAIQGELSVEQIIDAALQVVIERTGASEASVAVFAHDGKPESGLERTVVRAAHMPIAAVGSQLPHLIDIPLARGSTIVGRMRLHMPEGAAAPDLLTSATVQNIGQQVASSIQLGQLIGDLRRQKAEGEALYDVLLRVSNQKPLPETLGAVVRHVREMVDADDGVIRLTAATSALFDAAQPGVAVLADGSTCIGTDPDRFSVLDDRPLACGVDGMSGVGSSMHVSLTSKDLNLGELWVGRSSPFTLRDRGFVQAMGELAAIGITNARMRESERQSATIAERERIAREMHDSLAQALGVIHIRLRALGASLPQANRQLVATGLGELADLAEEAYRDVREAILGLRESSRVERSLFESLRIYLTKYEHQSGIRTSLELDPGDEPLLTPRAEIHIIRVIQEALTNVRKHAAASAAVVRVSRDDGLVSFRIEDDGRGFEMSALLDRDTGFGLSSMRERMELIGGTLGIDSAPGHGTRLVARVPELRRTTPPSSEAQSGDGPASGRRHADVDSYSRPARR